MVSRMHKLANETRDTEIGNERWITYRKSLDLISELLHFPMIELIIPTEILRNWPLALERRAALQQFPSFKYI